MDQNEIDYLRRREAQHRARADASDDPASRGVHGQLADAYAERARLLEPPLIVPA